MLEETIQEYRKVLENSFDLSLQTTKSDLIDYYNGKAYCYSFLLSHKLLLIVSFPHVSFSEFNSSQKDIYKLEYFLLDIDYFENKDTEEKIDYNNYLQHEELLSHIKRNIAENFKKVFCRSVYQGCTRDLKIYLSDINEAITYCNNSHFEIPLAQLFSLIQEIFLPKALKNKHENMRVSTENFSNFKIKAKKIKKKKPSQCCEEINAGKNPMISPNSPYLRKFRSQFLGNVDEFEVLSIPNIEVINWIFMNIIEFFFKKIHDTNYFVSHGAGFDIILEKIREKGQENLLEYLNSSKKQVFFYY